MEMKKNVNAYCNYLHTRQWVEKINTPGRSHKDIELYDIQRIVANNVIYIELVCEFIYLL